MSKVQITKITDRAGTGSPNFSNGFTIAGADSGFSGFTHFETTTEGDTPDSPDNGDTWWNASTNEYKVFANGGWQTLIGSGSSSGGLTSYTGDRGVFTAGANNGVQNHINYISISTTGNATDFGDMSVAVFKHNGGASNTSRGLFMGGRNSSNANVDNIQYITFATPGNSTDFGDIHAATYELCTTTNGTYGLYWGGVNTGVENTIQYVTVATTGNSTNFGNMTAVNALCTPISGSTRNLRAGGDSADTNVIDYVTVATPGNATDFGDLSVVAHSGESVTDDSRAVIALGREGVGNQVQDTMEYITVDTAGNTTDFGDLTAARHAMGATSSNGRGCFGGGGVSAYTNVIDYITIQTPGNATDFGDLVTAFGYGGSCSGAAS